MTINLVIYCPGGNYRDSKIKIVPKKEFNEVIDSGKDWREHYFPGHDDKWNVYSIWTDEYTPNGTPIDYELYLNGADFRIFVWGEDKEKKEKEAIDYIKRERDCLGITVFSGELT